MARESETEKAEEWKTMTTDNLQARLLTFAATLANEEEDLVNEAATEIERLTRQVANLSRIISEGISIEECKELTNHAEVKGKGFCACTHAMYTEDQQ